MKVIIAIIIGLCIDLILFTLVIPAVVKYVVRRYRTKESFIDAEIIDTKYLGGVR